MKAVRFDEYGEIEVLRVDDVERPVPGAGQVLVKVAAASVNPGEMSIRTGILHAIWPANFPSGQGSDLAGTVAEVGAGVEGLTTGDEVYGFTDDRGSHAEYVLVEAGNLAIRPPEVPAEQAATLYVAGTTAYAELRAVGVEPGDTIVITAAAGGVGTFAVQLAVRAGATVVGLASERHHQWLRDVGAIPVTYGEGVAERIKAAVGDVDAFVDNFGGYTELALELGVDRDRINTIDRAAAAEHGVKAHGNAEAAEIKVVAELADLIKAGDLRVPIAATYPLAQVQDAFRELEKRHTRGKILLKP
ncbi:NADP-dependent oxidoreductase [Actinomadura barringtoniae]|uniref:NADP-dependent oxidoreductase n=2 Tax=Actinomadura barringtoniae TaxID=1427535 RepID=A0A939P7P7_9ACTN|nr:NADP-dependent oxidoreductase [Actinomadura barringtoniae]